MKQIVAFTDFSMRPVDPTQVDNPVVRTLNMVRSGDGSWRRRDGFASASGPGSTVLNHVSCEIGGRTMLVVKLASGAVRYWLGSGSWITLDQFSDSTDRPLGLASWATNERGAFALHGGELYIIDSKNLAAYDGLASNQLRRPGVKSLAGVLYYKDGTKPSFDLAKAEGSPNATAAMLQPIPSISPLTSKGTNPGLTQLAGEKILNTGFAFSVYDPKRGIYGRRSDVCALPYVFGPPNPSSLDIILTDERAQFSKEITTPGSPTWIPAGHKVAVWFTQGTDIITNRTGTVKSGWFFFFNQWAPAMSPRMSGVLFLEGIFEPGTNISCRKDNASLARSGLYVDAYARPNPSLCMAVLQNGTAIYFFPRTDENNNASPIANFAEYSVDHPEQVSRLSESNRDTRSPLANIKGAPVYVVQDGDRSLMLTKQTVYQIGFDGRSAVLQDATNGRGIASDESISVSSAGVMWYCDDGVVLLRGGQMILLDKRLGFETWFDGLNGAQKRAVVCGACDSTSQVFAGAAASDDPSKLRFMVYDTERRAVSEFRFAPSTTQPTRMAYFRSSGESRLVAFQGASMMLYPSGSTDAGNFYESHVEAWLSQSLAQPKTLQEITLGLGARNGSVVVTVDAFEHPGSTFPLVASATMTFTLAGAEGPGRFPLGAFMGMRGRLFRIVVASTGTGAATSWSLSRIQVDYETDEEAHAISH